MKNTANKSDMKTRVKNKALATPDANAVGERVANQIIDKATDTHVLLNEVDRIEVESTEYKTLVVTSRPQVALTGEQDGFTSAPVLNNGQRYVGVSGLFGKIYAQALLTDEIVQDAKIDLESQVVRLTSDDFRNVLVTELLYGDESRSNGIQRLREILHARIDKPNGFSEALKADNERHPDFYQVVKTGLLGSFGANSAAIRSYFVSLKKSLPTKYKRMAKWYMNADVFETLEQVVDSNGQSLLIHWGRSPYSREESFMMLGHPIVIIDQMNGEGDNETPVMFGDLRSAIKVLDLKGEGSYFTVDQVTVKGANIVYVDSRYGEIMQANDAIRVALQAA